MKPVNISMPKIYDGDEKELLREVIEELDREIIRLKKLKDEKKLLSKIRILVRSCFLLARSDGESFEEVERINNTIFRRFGIRGKNIRTYCRSIKNMSLTAIKQDIEKYKIEKDFLTDVYNELCALAFADKEVTEEEDRMLSKIKETFQLPFLVDKL